MPPRDDWKMGLMLIDVVGQSMWPNLRDKAKVLVRRTPLETLGPGDIVVYRHEGQMICHRIVKIEEAGKTIWVRGDAAFGGAQKITPEQLTGRVVGFIRQDRVVSLDGFFRRGLGRLVILAGPLANIFARAVSKFLKKR